MFPLCYSMLEFFIAVSCFLNVGSPTGKTEYVQENDINMDCKEIGWEGMDWINVSEDRGMRWASVNSVMNLHVP